MIMKQKAFIDWESGILPKGEEVELFQELLSSGELGDLPAKYSRRAEELRSTGDIGDDEG